MYAIPEDRVPATLPTSFVDWTSISRQDLEALLHGVTPFLRPPDPFWVGVDRAIDGGGPQRNCSRASN